MKLFVHTNAFYTLIFCAILIIAYHLVDTITYKHTRNFHRKHPRNDTHTHIYLRTYVHRSIDNELCITT